MSAHTPGPWSTRGSARERGTVYVEAGSPQWLLASVSGQGVANEANARLIAAAPDLLEACRDAMAMLTHPEVITAFQVAAIHGFSGSDEARAENIARRGRIEAAIAKAEGR